MTALKNETGDSSLLTQEPTGYVSFAPDTEKPAPIIDADRRQAQSANLTVSARIGSITRACQGKTWCITGAIGPYLVIQTKKSHGNIRLISADAYQRRDCYPLVLPVFAGTYITPIIDADATQITVKPRRSTQPEIIIAAEMGI